MKYYVGYFVAAIAVPILFLAALWLFVEVEDVIEEARYNSVNDPYGVIEAEVEGGTNERLFACANNKGCTRYADALFWMATHYLSEAHYCDDPEYDVTFNIKVDDLEAMPEDEKNAIKEQRVFEGLMDNFDARCFETNPDHKSFPIAFNMLQKAEDAGSIYASNELGLIYMEIPELKNFDISETHFKKGLLNKDPNAAYNLARLYAVKDVPDFRVSLFYLRKAKELDPESFELFYLLGMAEFGNFVQKESAKEFLQGYGESIERQKDEFYAQFNLLVDR